MFNVFSKGYFSAFFTLVSICAINSSLTAWDCCDPCNRVYIGAFGGGIYSEPTNVYQMGTAFFPATTFPASGGALAVDNRGRTNSTSSGFGGVQLGYEWTNSPLNNPCSAWGLSPALEIEGFWYSHTKQGHLINITEAVSGNLGEHDFLDSFDMDMGVYLVNAVFTLNSSRFWGLSPYIGAGVGATRISISNATSTQVAPPELGVNHFNSLTNDSTWTFAAQVKVGVRYNICKAFHIFGEYRYLYVDPSNYIFGSTLYAAHVPTSAWNVKIRNIQYNAFAVGVQYDLN